MEIRQLRPEDVPEVEQLLASSNDERVLSEAKSRRLGSAGGWVAQSVGGRITAVAQTATHLTPDEDVVTGVEIITPPAADQLFLAMCERVTEAIPGHVEVWAVDADQSAVLRRQGWSAGRVLLRLDIELPITGEVALPDLYRLVTYRPQDERDFVAANNAAFARHADNSHLTMEEFEARQKLPWFDPDDVLVAKVGESIAGFCWTKKHEAAGEIYIIGVTSGHRGIGLGQALITAGLAHLHDRYEFARAFLYSDADNDAALHVYEAIGFVEASRRWVYVRPGDET
ncbi:MAG: GNAT family N-acetyltransferase [Acidimicrobiia bacterium]|nr:GNAT family N-acetyltransferase [Acidimicrobiia bacterium]